MIPSLGGETFHHVPEITHKKFIATLLMFVPNQKHLLADQ